MRRPAWLRATIGLQLVALIVACLAATHLVTIAAVVLMPPPRPPLYAMREVAAALEGGALTTRLGRPMLRATSIDLPAEFDRAGATSPAHRDALAAVLGRPGDDVRLAQRQPSTFEALFAGPGVRRVIVEHRRRGPGPPPADALVFGSPGGPGLGQAPPRLRAFGEHMLMGDFAAAVRRADGAWTVVRSTPEPFPTAWQRRTLILLGASFMVVAPAGFLFARRITAPLKRFSEAAERLGRDPRAPPVALSGPAEIGAAAEAFNDMQARLKRYVEDRTAKVGAISHDLRTPLARIRFKLEGADPGLKDAVLSDVSQMEQMIQGVLTFIRDESAPRRREKLDLLSLVECVADDAALVGGDVEVLDFEPVTVEGDPVALQRLFANLVDNALKYGRRARVAVRREGEVAVVEIADAGDGLPPEDLDRVFQPFYRADSSRNLDSGGIGLGLPIARATARAHGGDVELWPAQEGLVARVTLPLA